MAKHNSETTNFIKRWAQEAHQLRWNNVSGLRHSKIMMHGPTKDLTMDILALNRRNTRLVTSLITGHCGLRKHLQTMGFHQDHIVCRLCGECEETATHVILECNSLLTWRLSVGLADPLQDIHGKHLTISSQSKCGTFSRRIFF
uniref:Reverse transcriptase zinc-binding domain-containing protein n=2 Tax=Cacopsylla melanoneura TaxID=428564 RepID=A0A8D8USJ1_9HEMI